MVGSGSSAGHHCECVVEILSEHQNSEDSNIVDLLLFDNLPVQTRYTDDNFIMQILLLCANF